MVNSPGGVMHATGLTGWGPGTATSQVTCNTSRGHKINWNRAQYSVQGKGRKEGRNPKRRLWSDKIHHDWQGSFLGNSWVLAYIFIATGRNYILHTPVHTYMDPISRWWLTVFKFHTELCIICMSTGLWVDSFYSTFLLRVRDNTSTLDDTSTEIKRRPRPRPRALLGLSWHDKQFATVLVSNRHRSTSGGDGRGRTLCSSWRRWFDSGPWGYRLD